MSWTIVLLILAVGFACLASGLVVGWNRGFLKGVQDTTELFEGFSSQLYDQEAE